ELEEKIEARFDILKERVTSYQKSGGNIGFIEVLFGSKSFGDFISRASAVTKITNSDTELIKAQEQDKAEVEKIQTEVEKKLAEQKEAKVELEGMEALILDQQAENKASKKKLEKKERQLAALKSDLEDEDSSLAALESEIRRDILQATTQVASNSSSTVNSNANTSDNNLTVLSDDSGDSGPAVEVKSNGNIDTAITAGSQHLGTPYRWAGKSPSGFDCSGFVSWAFGQAGISIPSNTGGLSGTGTKVSYSDIQPGDLVFFNTYKTNGHVGIYVGNGQFIGSQNSTGLAYADMTSGY